MKRSLWRNLAANRLRGLHTGREERGPAAAEVDIRRREWGSSSVSEPRSRCGLKSPPGVYTLIAGSPNYLYVKTAHMSRAVTAWAVQSVSANPLESATA